MAIASAGARPLGAVAPVSCCVGAVAANRKLLARRSTLKLVWAGSENKFPLERVAFLAESLNKNNFQAQRLAARNKCTAAMTQLAARLGIHLALAVRLLLLFHYVFVFTFTRCYCERAGRSWAARYYISGEQRALPLPLPLPLLGLARQRQSCAPRCPNSARCAATSGISCARRPAPLTCPRPWRHLSARH